MLLRSLPPDLTILDLLRVPAMVARLGLSPADDPLATFSIVHPGRSGAAAACAASSSSSSSSGGGGGGGGGGCGMRSRAFTRSELHSTLAEEFGACKRVKLVVEATTTLLRGNAKGEERWIGARCEVKRLLGPSNLPSPCVVVRDPFGDKGRTVCLAMERTRRAPAGANGFGGRQQGAAVGADSSSRVPKELRELADRVLDMAHRAVVDKASWASAMSDAQRTLAAKAIQHHRPYYLAQAIPYPAGGSLPNHVDGVGWWVVLFNLGCDSTFHISTGSPVGGFTTGSRGRGRGGSDEGDFTFRSGDALVFNGDPKHGAVHGMSQIHRNTAPKGLVSEFRWLNDRSGGMNGSYGWARVSLQIRQM